MSRRLCARPGAARRMAGTPIGSVSALRLLAPGVAALAGLALSGGSLRAANYSCSWNNGSGGDWATSADWSSCSGYPANNGVDTYDATIGLLGTYTVTLSSPITIGTLTLNDPYGTLSNSSILTATNGVMLDAGTISGGTIKGTGGASSATAVTIGNSDNGTLDGVTLNGSLDVTGQNATAYISNGLTVTGTSGSGAGVINVTGENSSLYFQGSQTLDNATVNLGGSSTSYDGYGELYAESGTLTLGSGLKVVASGADSYAYLDGTAIVNDGTISLGNTGSWQTDYINPTTFTNNGTVAVTNGVNLQMSGSTVTNAGTMTVGAGSQLNAQYNSFTNTSTGTISGADTSQVFVGSNAGTITMAGATNDTSGAPATVLGLGYQANEGANSSYEWTNTGTISASDTDLRLGGYFTQSDIGTINRSNGGTVELLGYLENTGTKLNVASGVLAGMTMSGGTIHGGTIQGGSSNLFTAQSASGTLDGVTLNGSLDVTGQNATAYISNGLTVTGTSGTGAGVINVTGENSSLYFQDTQTLDNATVNLGGSATSYDGYGEIYAESGTLTLGSGLKVVASGADSYAYLDGSAIVNDGTITLSNTGNWQTDYIDPITFTNNGTVAVTNGVNLQMSGSTVTNAGTMTVGSGSLLNAQYDPFTNTSSGTVSGADTSQVFVGSNAGTITMAGATNDTSGAPATVLGLGYQANEGANSSYEWTNTGTISASDTDLRLGGYFTLSDVGTINRTNGGTVELLGYLDNTGTTLNVASGALAGMTMSGGTIHGGTIQGGSSNLFTAQSASGTLDGVTLNGSLDVTGQNATAYISNGLTVTGTSGTGAGVINVTGYGAALYTEGTQTLDNATVNLGGSATSYDAYGQIFAQSGTLTLGSGLNVMASGSDSYAYVGGLAIVNDGTITFGNTGSWNTDYIDPDTFTNSGTVAVTNGATAYIEPTTLTNLSAGTLTGGSYQADAGSTLSIYSVSAPSEITTLAADMVLSGSGSVIQSYASGSYVPVESSLTTIGATGALHVLQGRDYTTSNGITNQGTLELGGGTFTASSLANSGTVKGFGTVAPQIQNTGVVEATGGTLTATAGITGPTGTVQIDSSGALTLGAASTTGTLINNGASSGALDLGANNVTVSTAYDNANFGSGNSFNAHANVTGTGQILAAGSSPGTAQTLSINSGTASSGNEVINFGAVHVGTTTSQTYTIGNANAGGPALQGAIETTVNGGNINDSRLSGSGVTAQNWGPVAAGGSTGAYTVTFDATSGGALNDQTVHVANNFDNTNSQSITIEGAGYNLASGQTTPAPITIANQRVGGTGSQALTVSNAAPSGSYTEALNASFGANTGDATNNGGSITGGYGAGGIAGGGSNASAMSVGVDTSSAGAKTGTVTLNYVSNGTGTSGLGNTGIGSQTITVSGNVYQAAAGQINTAPLNFGTVQVGQAESQTLSVSNVATGPTGYVEDLNASFGTATGTGANLISGTGSISGLAAGGTDSAHMTVSVDTSVAGTVNGSIGVNFYTAGTVNGVTDGLGVAPVGSTSYGVSGTIQTVATVINDADPVINNSPIDLGNVRVGATSPVGLVSITNQATTAPQAALDASVAGNGSITGSGSFNLLAPGSTDNSHLQVGMDTSTAGHVSGTATVSLISDASNVGGCSPSCQMMLPSQDVTVTGNVFEVAQPSLPTTVSLGNFHVGSGEPTSLSQTITVSNTLVAAGYQEGLNASAGSTSGQATIAGGPIVNLAAGGSSSALSVGLTGLTAGANSGVATLNLASNGAGTSGLGVLDLPSQSIEVTGTGYNLAAGSTTPTPITLANQRVGGTGNQVLMVSNTAPSGSYTEALNASFGANAGDATNNGGSITGGYGAGGIAGGGSNGSAMSVGVDTSSAGAKTGTVTLDYVSNGTGTSGLGNTTVGSQTIAVSGNVYRLASPTLDTPSVTLAARVGDASPSQTIGVTNSSPDQYTEGLAASLESAPAGWSTKGSIGSLAAGATDNTSLTVSLNTAHAGSYTGTQQVDFVSNGQIDNATPVSVGTGSVQLSGTVYTPAVAQVNTSSIDFGVVHVGQTVGTQAVSVSNGASSTPGYNDVLLGSLALGGGSASQFSAGGSIASGLGAGASDTTDLKVGLDTSAAGSYTGTAQFNGVSHDSQLSDIALSGTQTVSLSAQVNDYADAALELDSAGSLVHNGSSYLLDLGNMTQGSTEASVLLSILNAVSAPQQYTDYLEGNFSEGTLNDLSLQGTGWSTGFSGLEAGQSWGASLLALNVDTATLGSFSDTISLNGMGYYPGAGGDYNYSEDLTLTVEGDIVNAGPPTVPEPGTPLLLTTGGALLALAFGRRRRRERSAARPAGRA